MKPKSIGIVGGAGPQAGVFLLDRLFSLARTEYGCHKDADFPEVFLISFPFSDMLGADRDFPRIQMELSQKLQQLRQNGASILAIACNTLHVFLDPDMRGDDFIHLPQAVANALPQKGLPLVLCTSTSSESELHRQFFPCQYPDAETQHEVDTLIDAILKGVNMRNELEQLIQRQTAETVVLGCTELSLYSCQLSIPNKQLIDPLEILAIQLLKQSYRRSPCLC